MLMGMQCMMIDGAWSKSGINVIVAQIKTMIFG
jgi:hypothetical protein